MKGRCDVVYDETGTLLEDVFYQFVVQFDESTIDDDRDASWIVVPQEDPNDPPDETRWLWAQVLHKGLPSDYLEYRYECTASQEHPTRAFVDNAKTFADLFGGIKLSEFIPNGSGDEVVVSEKFAARLKDSGLTGLRFSPLRINVNQSATEKMGDPQLFLLEFTGRIWQRPCKIVAKPNACPHCQFSPLICTTCGHWYAGCPNCRKNTVLLWSAHPGGNDKRLKHAGVPADGLIAQGSTWDGRDFVQTVGANFITKRALDWLLRVHAKPFYVRPAQVLIDGMTAEQRSWIERAREPLT